MMCQHGRDNGYLCPHCNPAITATATAESVDAVVAMMSPETPGGLTFAEIGRRLLEEVFSADGDDSPPSIGKLAAELVTKGKTT